MVKDITGISLPQNNSDMFEAGLDSLQASHVQHTILNQLKNSGVEGPLLEKDFCFVYPSVDKMAEALLSQFRLAGEEVVDEEEGRLRGMKEMVKQYQGVLCSYASLLPMSKNRADKLSPPPQSSSSIVLLTGSTGNLGCFLLAQLAKDPGVSKVICLNRPCSGSESIHQRQKDTLERRGACVIGLEEWERSFSLRLI